MIRREFLRLAGLATLVVATPQRLITGPTEPEPETTREPAKITRVRDGTYKISGTGVMLDVGATYVLAFHSGDSAVGQPWKVTEPRTRLTGIQARTWSSGSGGRITIERLDDQRRTVEILAEGAA